MMNFAASIAHEPSAGRPPETGRASPPVLLVPGLGNSGPGHWQTRWGAQHRDFLRVVQPDWNSLELDAWAAAVAHSIDSCRAAPIVVAHGFGCLAAVRAGHFFERTIAGALLVAPVDPDASLGRANKLPSRPLPYPSLLVASTNDPCIKLVKAGALATRWGSRFVPLADVGHLDDASNVGRWADGLLLLAQVRDRVAASRRRFQAAEPGDVWLPRGQRTATFRDV